MEELNEFLRTIGFKKNEADVYLALVSRGTSTVLELAKVTQMHRSNIYDSLRALVAQGLVYTIDNPNKQFSARDPHSLLGYLHHRQLELDELLRKYASIAFKKSPLSPIRVTQGSFALREAIQSLLKEKEPINVFGVPVTAPEIIGPMIKEFHRERIKRKIIMRHIYNADASERVNYLNGMKYTEARLFSSKYSATATTSVAGNRVVIFIWNNPVTVIEMEGPELAQTYSNYFNMLWAKARVVK